MTKKYFKTNDPLVIKAHDTMVADSNRLFENCKKFAELFDGVNMMSTSSTGRSFGGLKLNNYYPDIFNSSSPVREDTHLWTVPDQHGISWPRKAIDIKKFKKIISDKDVDVKEAVKKAKADLDELRDKWSNERVGMEPVSFDPFFKSFGTDWGNLMFSGLRWFPHDGHIYFETGADFRDRMTEILGSEFEAAEAAQKS